MKYKGIKLQEFKSDKPVVFDPPRKMLCWDDIDELDESLDDNDIIPVHAFLPELCRPAITMHGSNFRHCAEIPEEPKSRRATNLELAKWLAHGKGQYSLVNGNYAWTSSECVINDINDACPNSVLVRKWDDKEWHEPTADYMGLEG